MYISAYRELRKWLMGQTSAWKWYVTTKINVNKIFNNVGTYLYNNVLRGSIGGKCLNVKVNDTNELIYETERDSQT